MNVNNVNELSELLDRDRSTLSAFLAELKASDNDENASTGGGLKENSTVSTKEKVSTINPLVGISSLMPFSYCNRLIRLDHSLIIRKSLENALLLTRQYQQRMLKTTLRRNLIGCASF